MPNPNINYQPEPAHGPHRDPDSKITSFYGDYGHRVTHKVKGRQEMSWSQSVFKSLTNAEINLLMNRWEKVDVGHKQT